MRKLFLSVMVLTAITGSAQNNTASNIIEGGKTLVDLIRVFKTPKLAMAELRQTRNNSSTDSCVIKGIADIGYKNNSGRAMIVSLYKRSNNQYVTVPLTLKISNNSQEFLFEIQSGIYKYKIEYEEGEKKIVYKEGEIKISSCEKIVKEINKE